MSTSAPVDALGVARRVAALGGGPEIQRKAAARELAGRPPDEALRLLSELIRLSRSGVRPVSSVLAAFTAAIVLEPLKLVPASEVAARAEALGLWEAAALFVEGPAARELDPGEAARLDARALSIPGPLPRDERAGQGAQTPAGAPNPAQAPRPGSPVERAVTGDSTFVGEATRGALGASAPGVGPGRGPAPSGAGFHDLGEQRSWTPPFPEARLEGAPPPSVQSLGHLKQSARVTRDPDQLARLATSSDPRIVQNVLLNPRLTEELVVRIAARRPARPEPLIEIWKCSRWSVRRRVRRALVLNPYLPPAIGAKLVPLLTREDWDEIARTTALHPQLRRQARRLLAPGEDGIDLEGREAGE